MLPNVHGEGVKYPIEFDFSNSANCQKAMPFIAYEFGNCFFVFHAVCLDSFENEILDFWSDMNVTRMKHDMCRIMSTRLCGMCSGHGVITVPQQWTDLNFEYKRAHVCILCCCDESCDWFILWMCSAIYAISIASTMLAPLSMPTWCIAGSTSLV